MLIDRDKLLKVIPADHVVVDLRLPVNLSLTRLMSEKEKRLYSLFVKCTRLEYNNNTNYDRGVFKFRFHYLRNRHTIEYNEVIVSEGSRSLHFYHRFHTVIVSAKSDADLEFLSTMALLVL